jgi:Protein of unknown function (DUF1275)
MPLVGETPDQWLSFGLAFVGGFGDAAGFILARTFTGHVTGTMVLAAVSIAARDWTTTAVRLSCVAFFLAGSEQNTDKAGNPLYGHRSPQFYPCPHRFLRSWSVCCPGWCTRTALAAACPCATASAMLASTYRIDEGPTTSAVVVSDIAGVFTMAMWIYVAEKMWA